MLEQLQQRHSELYRLDHDFAINDYLITGQNALDGVDSVDNAERIRRIPEKVLICEQDDAVELGVVFHDDVLSRLAAANPLEDLSDDSLSDLWLALEGVSHFNYLVFNASRDKQVSLLELELQAEVDKFVGTLFIAAEQGYQGIDRALYERLFEETRFDEHLNKDERERYTVASRYAGYFCQALLRRHRSDYANSLTELRDFFRLDQPAKVSHIHTSAY